jgi:hypothetical protein
MGEKAGTNEVISKLIVLINSDDASLSHMAAKAVSNVLNSCAILTRLNPKLILDICLSEDGSVCLRNISADELIHIFFTTKNHEWVPVVTHFALLTSVAVTAVDNEVVVYGRKEPLKLSAPTLGLCEELVKAFTDQGKRLYLAFRLSEKA